MTIARRHRLTGLAAVAALFLAAPAFGQGFVPPPTKWLREEPARPRLPAPEATPLAPEGLAVSPEATASPFRVPLVLSFNYADRHSHVELDTQGGALVGATDTSVYLGRVETYVGCSLRVRPSVGFDCSPKPKNAVATVVLTGGALAGYADGHSLIAGTRLDLDGPAVGASGTLLLFGPLTKIARPSGDPLLATVFFMPGFDYVATNYSEIDGWVNAYSVKPRTGVLAIDGPHTLYVYGGASWEDFTEKQTLSDTDFTTHSRPRRPWAGLIGATYAYTLDEDALESVSLAIEGEVGDRASIGLALRYAFSIPL